MKTYILCAMAALLLIHTAAAVEFEQNYTSPISVTKDSNAHFAIRTLKYEPFPVNPGEWFDVWVLVENVGVQDANDVEFTLELAQPFTESDDESYAFAVIAGKQSAHVSKLPGENDTEANQLLLKYHVRVADSAAEGTSTLKIRATYKGSATQQAATEETYTIPVSIRQTKTAFAVSMQESSSGRTVFAIANTGEKDAQGVTVSVGQSAAKLIRGSNTAIVGNLHTGDFSTAAFEFTPDADVTEVPLVISYTDAVGTRTTASYSVPVQLTHAEQTSVPSTTGKVVGIPLQWVFGFLGLVIGIIIGIFLHRRPKAEGKE